jgi:hypothetical protein
VITQVSRATVVSATHSAFLVGVAVALDGAILALVTRQRNAATEGHAAM